jgi:hypothetical protein
MWWMSGNNDLRPDDGLLERELARRPLRAAIICLVIAAALAAGYWLTRHPVPLVFASLFLLMSLWLFVYNFIRKGVDRLEKRNRERPRRRDKITAENGPSRQEIVARWRDRARQREMDEAIEKARRGR